MSTGTKAVYLSPTDALHGDIGIVGRDDLVVMVSKSGATEELLRLVPYAKACCRASLSCTRALKHGLVKASGWLLGQSSVPPMLQLPHNKGDGPQ